MGPYWIFKTVPWINIIVMKRSQLVYSSSVEQGRHIRHHTNEQFVIGHLGAVCLGKILLCLKR